MKTIPFFLFSAALLPTVLLPPTQADEAPAPSADELEELLYGERGRPHQETGLHACIEDFCSYINAASQLACLARARQLLEQDATSIHALDEDGQSPLYHLAFRRSASGDLYESERERYADFVALLLTHGADPLKRESFRGGACAADLLAAIDKGALLPLLRARGVALEAPPHVFEEKGLAEQLLDLPADAIRREEIAAAYELLASLLPPPGQSTVDLRRYENHICLFEDHLPELAAIVLPLLHRADAARTQQLLRAILLDKAARNEQHPVTRALFRNQIFEAEPAYPCPLAADELAGLATAAAAEGHPRLAHAYVHLMSLCPAAAPIEEQFCREDAAPALQAAAWSNRLRRAGLPRPGRSYTRPALGERLLPEDLGMELIEPLRLVHAVNNLGLAPEEMGDPFALFFDHPYLPLLPEMRAITEAGIDALRRLGAPKAADYLSALSDKGAAGLNSSAVCDAAGMEASFEAEIAMGRYIWQHREEIAAWLREFHKRVEQWRSGGVRAE